MGQIKHYQGTGTISFEVSGSLEYHEVVKIIEDRLKEAASVIGSLDGIKRATIVTIDVDRTDYVGPTAGGKG